MRVTSRLYYDEALALGLADARDAYPPISQDEKRLCHAFAKGLYLSESLVQWSLYRWRQNQDRSGFDRMLSILSAGRLKRLTPA